VTRDSTKHGPRLDDALAGETQPLERGAPLESRAREDLEKEDAFAPGLDSPVEARRELSRHLRLSAFPTDRAGLLAEAEGQDAPDEVLRALRELPASVECRTVHEVWAALEGFADLRDAAAHEPLTEGER
jgi:hypothetical protein